MNEKIKTELGLMVLNAGHLEMSIRTCILSFSGKVDDKLMKSLLLPNNNVSTNLDILNRLINVFVDAEYKKNWLDCTANMKKLFEYRNKIFHSMYGVENEKIYFFSVSKGKRGNEDKFTQEEFNFEELRNNNIELSNRHRQLMDFIEGKMIVNSKEHSTAKT